jgi:hypothetical protein
VAQEEGEEYEGEEGAEDGVAPDELGGGAEGEEDDGGSPGAALVSFEAVGEEEEEDSGAEGECGGEGAEGAGEDFGDGVHAAGAEAWEDACGDVDEADERAGRSDEGGDLLGAWSAENPAYANRNRS